MDTKRKRTTYLLVASALCLAAWAASAMPRLRHSSPVVTTVSDPPSAASRRPPQTVTIPKAPPRVEIVFALDTTGSMSGLIDGAKRKIWSIAQFVASGQPKPELRIGLVAYRDQGDAYVTRFYDLSDDLDQVFERLSSFEAGGGGDTPEHVAKALHEAVTRTSWTAGQHVLKQIYLVGDAPPHSDYQDGYDVRALALKAHGLGIHINAIRCGNDRATQVAWRQISSAASGEYASIDQSGGVLAVATPFDDKLAALNAALVKTAIGYGSGAAELRRKASASMAMPKAEAADRAGFFALKGGAVGGGGDLVADLDEGKADLRTVPAAALPVEMRELDDEGRGAYVAQKQAARKKLRAEINALSSERKSYLTKNRGKPADAFDSKVEETIKAQAAAAGIAY